MGRREAFDPLRKFVANRTFKYGVNTYNDGDPFNERGDMRRVRQLYDGRYLRFAPYDANTPDFKSMNEAQLRQWLIDAGNPYLAHPRSKHFRLVERCQRVWADQAAAPKAEPAKPTASKRVAAPAPAKRTAVPPKFERGGAFTLPLPAGKAPAARSERVRL